MLAERHIKWGLISLDEGVLMAVLGTLKLDSTLSKCVIYLSCNHLFQLIYIFFIFKRDSEHNIFKLVHSFE